MVGEFEITYFKEIGNFCKGELPKPSFPKSLVGNLKTGSPIKNFGDDASRQLNIDFKRLTALRAKVYLGLVFTESSYDLSASFHFPFCS